MCVVLQVSRNGYYDWRDRPESKRSKENRIALSQIREGGNQEGQTSDF
jgi:putative transposase